MTHLHIIGICGTFMGNLALLARDLGYRVTGSDLNSYPPMSDMLAEQGVEVFTRYHPENLQNRPDIVLVGNTISRSNHEVDAMLETGVYYTSGPQWLYENILRDRAVIAVAGTHGKTTTSSMIAWILDYANYSPGYLIGGIAQNFSDAAKIGEGEWFVVESDEYDTAYFDKRSKFVHYRPRIATMLNLEFDHADIFDSIEDIERQFDYFIRTLPSSGRIIVNSDDARLQEVVSRSAMASPVTFSIAGQREADWYVDSQSEDYRHSRIHSSAHGSVDLNWKIPGRHNTANALAAVATVCEVGVDVKTAVTALQKFKPVKRRLELLAELDGITVYDDFAHHPSAIRTSIDAVSKLGSPRRVIAVFEPRSNTMRMGIHGHALIESFEHADQVYMYRAPNVVWDESHCDRRHFFVHNSVTSVLEALESELTSGDSVLIMSNGGFDNLQNRLIQRLQERTVSLTLINARKT